MKKLLYSLFGLAGVALIGTLALAQAPGVNSPFNPVWSIPIDSIKRTYSYGLSSLSPAQSATDIFQICGGANVVTRVTRVSVGGRATAVTTGDVVLVKRSTASIGANTFQISGSTAGVPMDANLAAGTATLWAWTANPTVGTIVGNLATQQITLSNLTTGVGLGGVIFQTDRPAMQPALRSSSQCLAVNLTGQSFAGNLFNITVEWTEE